MGRFWTILSVCLVFSLNAAAQQAVDADVLASKANNGDTAASTLLGKYYFDFEKAPKKAEKWLKQGAEAGNAEAQYYLARVYDSGHVGKHSNSEIVALLEKSASQGYVQAQVMLGRIYQFGRREIKKDLDQARKWYDMAAAKGSSEAFRQIEAVYKRTGDAYQKAVLADQNVEWLDLGARQGNAEAALKLAVLMQEGKQIPSDPKREFALYQQAAAAGIPQAEAAVGNMYANGDGVAADYEKAVEWLSKAALSGYVEAQRKLADVYAINLGEPAQAYAWQVISLSAMFPNAGDLVQVSPELERLMRSMTPDQIKDGQMLAVKLVETIKANKNKQEAEQRNQMEQMKRYQEGVF